MPPFIRVKNLWDLREYLTLSLVVHCIAALFEEVVFGLELDNGLLRS